MKRMFTPEEFEKEWLKNADAQTKSKFIKQYKNIYRFWLDDLKKQLSNYTPPFEDLTMRRAVSPSFNYQEQDLADEIWKRFPLDRRYLVSNFGRIKFLGIIQKQKDEKTGYVTLADENLNRDYVYNLVAYTFLGKIYCDGYHVHHITNDGYYNTVENLVLLTQAEHSYVHGFEIGGGKYGSN